MSSSLTGFLFGNVDEDGNISDEEMREALGGGGGGSSKGEASGNGYLSNILGGSQLFTDEQQPTPVNDSRSQISMVRPTKDAVDYSDFNELATEDTVAKVPQPLASSFKYSKEVERAQVDDDYDDDEEEEEEGEKEGEGDLEDLFGSSKPNQTEEEDEEETQQVPVAMKRVIPPGIIKFTEFFGGQVTRKAKRIRRSYQQQTDSSNREPDDDSTSVMVHSQPALDTRKLLTGTQIIDPDTDQGAKTGVLKKIASQSLADTDKYDVCVTVDTGTGEVTSQTVKPKHKLDSTRELFQQMPLPVDTEDWEQQITWGNNNTATDEHPFTIDSISQQLLQRSKNALTEDYESHIIWDEDTAFLPCTSLQINLNDPHMLFEEGASHIKESNAREAERQRLLEGVDRYNLSNDHYYEALQEGQIHRVRQTFGLLVIAHSLPVLRLQAPFFKLRQSRTELKSWHRPPLQVPPPTETVKFSRLRTAKKRKQKHSMENPWAAKDITLKDTAECVLVEYCEEYPLVMSNVGMGSVLVNYYRKLGMEDRAFPKVDLGELFILDLADISPFLNFGTIEPGQTIQALYNNLFRAPLYVQQPRKTDFLVVKHTVKGESKWHVKGIKHQYVAGQTYPLQEVPAPHSRKVTTTIKHRLQVAAYRLMNRNQYHLLQMGKLSRIFPEYSDLQMRQRLKEFCDYQRKGLGAGYWHPKGNMPMPDEENIRKMLTPEMLCVYESMRVCQQQLHDAGKLGGNSNKQNNNKDDEDDDTGDDTRLTTEETLATWNLTRNFINATQGKAMLELHGEGDPSGKGEGFSFIRVSMKDIFLRAGESVQEKLAEIEARPKSAHRYNVAEQQQIYKEEIGHIWHKQMQSLSDQDPLPTLEERSDAYSDELLIVPEINDYFGDSTLGQNVAALDPSHMVAGSAMEVSQKLSRNMATTTNTSTATFGKNIATAHANLIRPNRKGLVIRRAARSPYTGELMWKTEIVKDLAVIQAYLRQRRIIENLTHHSQGADDSFGLFGDEDDDNNNPGAELTRETQDHLDRLKRAKEKRMADARIHEKSHMTTFSLPQPNKPRKDVIRKCGNCGQLGHMKTNKKCPRYYEFNPV